MRILFLHRNFPGQFRHLLRHLAADQRHEVAFITAHDGVTISFENMRPVADAGNNDVVALGGTAILDGGGSVDGNGDPLTYAWSLTERPAGSTASLDDPAAVAPRFRADRYGEYRLSLSQLTREPSTVSISCLRQDGDAERFLVTAIDVVNLMDEGELKNASMRKTLNPEADRRPQTGRARADGRGDAEAARGYAGQDGWLRRNRRRRQERLGHRLHRQRDLVPLIETVVELLQ